MDKGRLMFTARPQCFVSCLRRTMLVKVNSHFTHCSTCLFQVHVQTCMSTLSRASTVHHCIQCIIVYSDELHTVHHCMQCIIVYSADCNPTFSMHMYIYMYILGVHGLLLLLVIVPVLLY